MKKTTIINYILNESELKEAVRMYMIDKYTPDDKNLLNLNTKDIEFSYNDDTNTVTSDIMIRN